MEERSGMEFDPELCTAFVRMMKQWEGQVAVLPDVAAALTATPAAQPQQGQV